MNHSLEQNLVIYSPSSRQVENYTASEQADDTVNYSFEQNSVIYSPSSRQVENYIASEQAEEYLKS